MSETTDRPQLEWSEHGDGWEAASDLHDDGSPFTYRIANTGNGWSIDATSPELRGYAPVKREYATLNACKRACQRVEDAALASAEAEQRVEIEDVGDEPQAEAEAEAILGPAMSAQVAAALTELAIATVEYPRVLARCGAARARLEAAQKCLCEMYAEAEAQVAKSQTDTPADTVTAK